MSSNIKYQKQTILQVVPALISGEIEKGTLEIAKYVVKNGSRSIVVSTSGPLTDSLIDEGSEHIILNISSKNPITILVNAYKLRKIIYKEKVDIVHVRSRAPAWSCYLASKNTKARLITTFHGLYKCHNYLQKIYHSVMTKGDKVIAVSHFIKNHILEKYTNIDPHKIVVIHRGVNQDKFNKNNLSSQELDKFRTKYKVPKNCHVLLLPARFAQWKGHLVLIDALAKLKNHNFYCIMLGDLSKHPEYVSHVQKKIYDKKLQSYIQLFGNEPNIVNLYGITDILLSSSIEPEAFGRTIIEAQSLEKLVIATNIGGACETIKDGVNGFHVEPNNADSLAQKIEYCFSLIDSDKEKNITKNARQNVKENFAIEKMLSETLLVYKEVQK